MVLDFISIDFDNSEIQDKDDLERLINPLYDEEFNEMPNVEKPCTILGKEISRIMPSIYNPNWTDVFLIDGDYLIAKMEYNFFKIKWLESLGMLKGQTFEDLRSLDEKIKIRFYLN